jgi:hypothetical protein
MSNNKHEIKVRIKEEGTFLKYYYSQNVQSALTELYDVNADGNVPRAIVFPCIIQSGMRNWGKIR